MKKVNSFEVIDHGVMASDYFQGCGAAFTEFSHVVTGIGDSISEAINDCLEQMAQCDFDTDGLEERIVAEYGDIPNYSDFENFECEVYHHVSIRWN